MRSDDSVGELVRRYQVAIRDKEELFTGINSIIQPTIRSCVHRHYAQIKGYQRWKYKEEEDLVLEICEHIVEKGLIDKFEGRNGANFQTYIYSVSEKYLLSQIRKGTTLREGGEETVESLDERVATLGEREEDVSSGGEISMALRKCISRLSVRERILISLFYYYRDPSHGREITDEDVLELLEIINPPLVGRERSLGNVKGVSTSRYRAVLRVKKCLEDGKFYERFDEVLQLI